jgi:hypothetical protein
MIKRKDLNQWAKLARQDWKTLDSVDWRELRNLNTRVGEVARNIHTFNMMERFE